MNDQKTKEEYNYIKVTDVDSRFNAYVSLYNNLDNLIWRIPGFMAATAAILVALVGTWLDAGDSDKIPYEIIGSMFIFIGMLFGLSWYSTLRIRIHHTLAGKVLKDMEPSGYFHQRDANVSSKFPPSATFIFCLVYAILMIASWVIAGLFLCNPDLIKEFIS